MQITKRDLDILRWVNSLGFVNINHVVMRYKISSGTAYKRLRKLISAGLLIHEYQFHGYPGHYRVTKQGAGVAGDQLPPLKNIRIGSYKHDEIVNTLSVMLTEKYDASFITERQMRHQRGMHKAGESYHYSDGVLVFDDKKVAIEVELTTKSRARLDKISKYYLRTFDYSEVWYFYSTGEVRNLLQKTIGKHSFVSLSSVDEVLAQSVSAQCRKE